MPDYRISEVQVLCNKANLDLSSCHVLSLCFIYCLEHHFLCVSVESYQDQSGEQGEEYETEEQLQARILTAALEFVPQHGWSMEAIASAAEVSCC